MITDELITYPTAQLAKQAGFNGACFYIFRQFKNGPVYEEGSFDIETEDSYWGDLYSIQDVPKDNERYLRPTQSLLQRWIREVYNYEVQVHYLPNIEAYCCTYTPKAVKPNTFKSAEEFKKHVSQYYSGVRHKTYESSLEEGLEKALTIIIKK